MTDQTDSKQPQKVGYPVDFYGHAAGGMPLHFGTLPMLSEDGLVGPYDHTGMMAAGQPPFQVPWQGGFPPHMMPGPWDYAAAAAVAGVPPPPFPGFPHAGWPYPGYPGPGPGHGPFGAGSLAAAATAGGHAQGGGGGAGGRKGNRGSRGEYSPQVAQPCASGPAHAKNGGSGGNAGRGGAASGGGASGTGGTSGSARGGGNEAKAASTSQTGPSQAVAAEGPDDESNTTVMLRNIPNRYTQQMLLTLLEEHGFSPLFDFVYLPMDFRNGVNLGYAFVNLLTHQDATRLMQTFQGFSSWFLDSAKVCEVSWAHPHQGLHEHVERYRNSPVMHPSMPDEYKPMVFKNGIRIAFPAPTKAIRAPKLRPVRERPGGTGEA